MERDDIIEYSLDSHHSEEAGKKIRSKIFKVTFILTAITVIEVIAGVLWPRNAMGADSTAWFMIKVGYILLTLVKAGYIVLIFMHLGDERKTFKWVVLAPYTVFILYLLWIGIQEANYTNDMRSIYEGDKTHNIQGVDTEVAPMEDAASTEE